MRAARIVISLVLFAVLSLGFVAQATAANCGSGSVDARRAALARALTAPAARLLPPKKLAVKHPLQVFGKKVRTQPKMTTGGAVPVRRAAP